MKRYNKIIFGADKERESVQEPGLVFYAEDTFKTYLSYGTGFQEISNLAGMGDMLKLIYDPNGIEADIFLMSNMVETANAKVLTALERNQIAANSAKVSNVYHGGEVTGDTTLTITDDVVDEANLKISNVPTPGWFLQYKDNTDQLTWVPSSGDSNYIHEQGIPNTVWDVTHNLGKNPSVIVVNSAGIVLSSHIEFIDTNNLTITHNYALTGKAYIN